MRHRVGELGGDLVRVQQIRQRRVHEGVGDGLPIAERRQRIGQRGRRRPPAGHLPQRHGPCRGPRPNAVVAVNPAHFFHQVFLDGDVEAVARRRDLPRPRLPRAHSAGRELQPLEDAIHLPFRDGLANEGIQAAPAQGDLDRARQLRGALRLHHWARGAAGDVEHEARRAFDGRGLQGVVHTAFVALGSVRLQAIAPRRAADGQRREVGALEEDILGGGRHGGALAAHHAGHGDGPGAVGDGEGLFIQGDFAAVQQLEPLAGVRHAHHDAASQPPQIEGVQRLAQLQQHVVRHIDRHVDGTEPRTAQPLAHPKRRLPGQVHAANDTAEIARAPHRGIKVDGQPVLNGGGHRVAIGGRDGDAVQRGHFPRDAPQRKAIAPVRREVQFNATIVQGQRLAQIGARRENRRQLQQPIRGIAQPQFGRRAQHPGRFHAAQVRQPNGAVRQGRADPGEWRPEARARVGRPAHHLKCPGAVAHLAHR